MFEVKLWTEITVGVDPALDNRIFQDEINFFECEKCGNLGFALYPIQITCTESGEKAMVIPARESVEMADREEVTAEGFMVLEVTDTEPCRIFYSLNEIKWQIHHWQGGDDTVFDPPPRERDIVEGLQKGIIDEHEAVLLRNVDWETLLDQINEQSDKNDGEFAFGDERDDIVDLYMKFMSALNCAKKVVPLRPQSLLL